MKRPDTHYARITFSLLLLTSLIVFSSGRAEAKKHAFNGKIVFISDRDGDEEIFVMNADGSNSTKLTNNTAVDANPAWSHDGKKIAFGSTRDHLNETLPSAEIYVMNADGSNQTRLTNNFNLEGAPSWSPDNSKIAFHSHLASGFEIFVMNADGTNQTRLTTSGGNLSPVWSPDGTKIVFKSNRDGNDEIYIMNADGTAQTRLTNNSFTDQAPYFSPDGAKIAFDSRRDASHLAEIFVMDVDGSHQTQLTNGSALCTGAAFSPDGNQIVFTSDLGNRNIVIMKADGTGQVTLDGSGANDTEPDWQPVFHADTIGVFRPSTSQFLLRNSNTTGLPNTTIAFGQPSDLPVAGDWDGDGRTDVGVFRNGQFLLRQPKTITVFGQPITIVITITVTFGQAGDLPVAGDWDGDGVDTVGVFRNGQFQLTNSKNINNSSPAADIFVLLGQAGDLPLAGDWNNDGIDTIGVLTPSTTTYRFSNNFNGIVDITPFTFGQTGHLPIAGDWDANGVDTFGTFNPITFAPIAHVVLSNTNATGNGNGDIGFDFGNTGDLPIAGDWDGKP